MAIGLILTTILPLVAGPLIEGIGKLFKKKPKDDPKTPNIDESKTPVDKPAVDVGKVGDVLKKDGVLGKLGQLFIKDGALTKGGKIGLIGAAIGLVGGIIGAIFKNKKAKKLEAAKLAEANKIDPPQTLNSSVGRQDYFNNANLYGTSTFNPLAQTQAQFFGFNRGYQGSYPPPPRVNPYARPQFNAPRMAQFNTPRLPYGRPGTIS